VGSADHPVRPYRRAARRVPARRPFDGSGILLGGRLELRRSGAFFAGRIPRRGCFF
jgi:hypothetical protein